MRKINAVVAIVKCRILDLNKANKVMKSRFRGPNDHTLGRLEGSSK